MVTPVSGRKRQTAARTSKKKKANSKPLHPRSESAASSTGKVRPVVSAKLQEAFATEKKLVSFLLPLAVSKMTSSQIFQLVAHVDWEALDRTRKMSTGGDVANKKGMVKLFSVLDEQSKEDKEKDNFKALNFRLVICPSCFKDVNVSLMECIIFCGQKGSASNITQHCQTYYPKELDSPGKKMKQQPLSSFVQPLAKDACVKFVKNSIYQCINDLGFPATTVEHPRFRQMLDTVRTNAGVLCEKDFQMSARVVTQLRVESYAQFVKLIGQLCFNVRVAYKSLCGKEVPFVSICHDMWKAYRSNS